MPSIRNTANSCLGVTSGTIHVREDVFGYIWGPMDRTLSVKNHLNLIKDTAFNLSVIMVAHEEDFSGAFTNADVIRMQAAIDVMRELYAQVGLGVRKIYWQWIPTALANGYSVVNASEATQLTEDWSGDNDGIDVFFVTTVSDAGGWSKTNGSCNKEISGRTGAVLELKTTDQFSGVLLAHEVGHYLGLSHGNDITQRILSEVSSQEQSELEEVDSAKCGARGEHFGKNCVGRNCGVGLWRLNERVI